MTEPRIAGKRIPTARMSTKAEVKGPEARVSHGAEISSSGLKRSTASFLQFLP